MKYFIQCTAQRFGELLISCGIISAIIYKLYLLGIVSNTYTGCFYILTLGAIVFAAVNVFLLRQCYVVVPHRRDYYKSNYIAYGAFVLVNAVVYFFLGQEIYTWFFCITKFVIYSPLRLSGYGAISVFHLIMLAVIALAPIKKKRYIY